MSAVVRDVIEMGRRQKLCERINEAKNVWEVENRHD